MVMNLCANDGRTLGRPGQKSGLWRSQIKRITEDVRVIINHGPQQVRGELYFSHGIVIGRTIIFNTLPLLLFLMSIDFRSEEHTSELQSLMRISYAVFCFTKKN